MLEQLVITLGKEAFELLSDNEKHIMKLFIWAGCGCHKDLNTVRGGYAAVMRWWLENDIEPPVLLVYLPIVIMLLFLMVLLQKVMLKLLFKHKLLKKLAVVL